MSENIPQEVMEDWYVILQRPGMNVLATHLSTQRAHLRSQLESTQLTATFEKLREIQGEMKGVRKVMQFVKSDTSDAIPAALPEHAGHDGQPCALTSINPAPGGAGNITLFHAGEPTRTRD